MLKRVRFIFLSVITFTALTFYGLLPPDVFCGEAILSTTDQTKPRLAVQTGHPGEIRNAIYSKSGRLLVTYDYNSIIIWETLSARELQRINVLAVDLLISSDDGLLAWVDNKGVVSVWDLSQQLLKTVLPVPAQQLVAFSNDLKSVVVLTKEGDLAEWGLEKQEKQNSKILTKGLCGDDCYRVLKYSEDKKLIATKAGRSRSVLYSFNTGKKKLYGILAGGSKFRNEMLSPNGKFVVVANDKRIEVKSLADGRLLHSFAYEGDGCGKMKMADDSNLLAAVSGQGGLKIWNLGSGREVFSTDAVNFCDNSISFSPDGGSVAVALGKQINIFNFSAPDGDSSVSLNGHSRNVMSATFTRKEGQIASFDGKELYLWDIKKKKTLWRLDCAKGEKGFKYSDLVASPEGRYLAVVGHESYNKIIKIVDLSHRKIIGTYGESDFISFRPDGNQAFVCSPKGCDEIYISNGRIEERRSDHRISIANSYGTSFAYSQDGDVLAFYNEYTPVSLHSLSGEILSVFPGIDNQDYTVSDDWENILPRDSDKVDPAVSGRFNGHSLGESAFLHMSGDNKLIVGYRNGSLDILDLTTGERVLSKKIGDRIKKLSVSPSGRRIAVLVDGTVKILQVYGRGLKTVEPDGLKDQNVVDVKFISEDLICYSDGIKLSRYDLRNDLLLQQISAVRADIHSVAASKDNVYMAIYTESEVGEFDSANQVEVWDLKKMVKTASLQVPQEAGWRCAMAFSSDGSMLAINVVSNKTIFIYDVQRSSVVKKIATGKTVLSLAFGLGNKWLAAGNDENEIDVWRLGDGKRIRTYKGHSDSVNTIDIGSRGEIFSGSSDGTIKMWKLNKETSNYSWKVSPQSIDKIRLSRSGKKMIVVIPGNSLLILDARTGAELHRVPLDKGFRSRTFDISPDERLLAYCTEDYTSRDVRVVDLSDGKVIFTRNYVEDEAADNNVLTVGFISKKRLFIQTSTSSYTIDLAGKDIRKVKQFAGYNRDIEDLEVHGDLVVAKGDCIDIWNMKKPDNIRALTRDLKQDMRVSPDGKNILTVTMDSDDKQSVELWDIVTGGKKHVFSSEKTYFLTASFSKDGKMIAIGGGGGIIQILDGKTLKPLHSMNTTTAVRSLAFSNDNKFVITGGVDQSVTIWDISTDKWLAKLYSFTDGAWAVVDPDGRFDTNNLEEIKGLHWIAPDESLTPLPLETFMKEYYEPNLLQRVLNRASFKRVKDLMSLNRVLPNVAISSVTRKGIGNTVSVTIQVAGQKRKIGKKELETGVSDLKLFRAGQLVGFREGRVELKPDGTQTIIFNNIRLPRKAGTKEVEFSAYAFNDDGIKSLTNRTTFAIPADITQVKGRAYLVTIGVNRYQNTAWNLNYASSDALKIRQSLENRIPKVAAHSDITPITLTDEMATKENIKAIFDLLSGNSVSADLKQRIPNADKLAKTTPEDLLIISFSGHGHVDDNGIFYSFTHDTGAGNSKTVTPELLNHIISSDELSRWLRYVDAGDMAMIVDACHSAATVGDGFKPGPMGSRGLGQLAYDKGMRILAASQADDVALESDKLQQGLLTYSLVHDGLEAFQADFKPADKTITLSELLAYAVDRVPKLYEEVKVGNLSTFGRGEASRATVIRLGDSKKSSLQKKNPYQTPALFDFTRKQKGDVAVAGQ